MALTAKQQRFVDEYLIDLNATQAAIRAGYSKKTASSQGERLLRNVEVRRYLQAQRQDLQGRTKITQEMVLKELAKIGFTTAAPGSPAWPGTNSASSPPSSASCRSQLR